MTERTPTDGKGLATGTLGLWGSVVIGLASTAPVYSLVATLGFVVLAVGAQAPIAFVLAFLPMLFIAFAYRELNNAVPDCGTTFTWGTKAFGPWVGWMGGWGVAVAGMVVLANLAQIAGIYFWSLFGDGSLSENVPLVTATGVAFIAVMTWVSWRGVELGERLQNILLALQYVVLAVFVVAALWQFFDGSAPDPTPFDIAWFNPFAFTEWSGFTEAVLLALFIYWGWDTCLALNEETRDPTRIPGRAAVLTTVILLLTYVGVTVAAMMYAGLGETGSGLGNEANADDVFLALRDGLFGPFGWVLVVAVLISAVSSTQTTILPTARGTLAMAAYKALPARFGTVHPRCRTPSFSTLVMGVVASLYYVGMTLISDNILQDSILSLGLAIAFYYAITGYACVWYFRRDLFTSARNLVYRGILPLAGALMLTYAFVQSAVDMYDVDYGYTVLLGIGGTFVVGIGALAVGVVLMILWFLFPGSKPFFRGESLNRDTPVLVPEDPADYVRSVDGGLA
ncbi:MULTISPECIES: APC family permease [Microbacterium]|uniref:APC family permease n=1 Tax=Microbacterium wangchenii TaxID=2541726 RepID=A0ABX5SSK2_9MICO|nr:MULTISPECIES: APC family permease [Microbacterium]MCK6066943.1 APC family permease [Microbacterium sp. EYE_512]QBR88242.1 APC family permease [Microbacterium wangchenii]TXK17968.1 APC family permease [Microbacterium wangchenii]